MSVPDDAATLAVVVARLDDFREQVRRDNDSLTKNISGLRGDIADSAQRSVQVETWQTRNEHVDQMLAALSEEIATVKSESAARHPPWWTTGALLLSGLALILNLVPVLTR